MVHGNCIARGVAVFTLLLCVVLINQAFACNGNKRFNKQDRYYRRHNYQRYFGKRSVDDYEKNEATKSTIREKFESFVINTSCGNVLCDSVLDYPNDAINGVVKELRQNYESQKMEGVDPNVVNYLSEYIKSIESSGDSPDIVYEQSKGCKAIGNVSFPQEGYSNDDGNIYYVVNVPDLQQKANGFWCQTSKSECGDDDVEIPATYSRVCQQVHRDEEFLVLPGNRNQYGVSDFRVRTFQVPDGCKCVLLHTVDYEFLKEDCKKN